MAKIHRMTENRFAFWCPGCDEAHAIEIGNGGWQFNMDLEKPTISPSILVQSGHYGGGNGCWCKFKEEHPEMTDISFSCFQCHSFVTEGKIQFLNDCSHRLAGQTVELGEWEI